MLAAGRMAFGTPVRWGLVNAGIGKQYNVRPTRFLETIQERLLVMNQWTCNDNRIDYWTFQDDDDDDEEEEEEMMETMGILKILVIELVGQRIIEWHKRIVQKLFQQTKWKLTLKLMPIKVNGHHMEILWNLQVDALHRNILYHSYPSGRFFRDVITLRWVVTIADQEMFSAWNCHLFWISNCQLLIDWFQRFSENPGRQRKDAFWTRYPVQLLFVEKHNAW